MDVLLNEDETLLRDAIRRFFESECGPARVRAAEETDAPLDAALWEALGELGWLGLALPAMHGGAEAPLTHLGLLFEEAGRALAPVPLHAHTVAATTLARAGSEAQQARLLGAAASGEARLTWAWSEGAPGLDPGTVGLRAIPDGNGWRLSGTKRFVDGFEGAAACLTAVRTGEGEAGLSLVLVDPQAPGVSCTVQHSLGGERQSSVHLEDVHVAGDDLVGEPGRAGPAAQAMLDLAVILNCAMIVGATRRAVERAVDYAKERVAFGKPIGSFQAIQHMCANMITWVDGAELLCREATWKLARGEEATLEVAAAKAFANERCQAALREANQIHGGVAQVREYDQQLWYRRAAAWSMRLGTSLEHRRTVARCLLP